MRHAMTAVWAALALAMVPGCSVDPGAPDAPLGLSPLTTIQPIKTTADPNGNILTYYEGPGIYCGRAFAIDLAPDEMLKLLDPRMDFRTYTLSAEQGSMVMYEGNYPQDAQAHVPTQKQYPGVIALHEDPEKPHYDAQEVAERGIVGPSFSRICAGDVGEQ